jgi:hypothetical protein
MSASVFGAGVAAQQPPAAGRTAAQQYKNLKLLNAVPLDQFMPTMRLFNNSLGVSCEHCHVEDDEANDAKPEKATARAMLQMVMNINKNAFDGRKEVTCYTCHHGSTDPSAVPPLANPNDKIIAELYEEPVPLKGLPSAEQVLAKYIEALGGEQVLRKVTSRQITMVANLPSGPREEPRTVGQIEQYQKAPNLSAAFTKLGTGTATATGFTGTVAWNQNAQGRVIESTGLDLERAKRDADFYLPLNWKQIYSRVTLQGIQKVGDHDCYVVLGSPRNDSPERLFFDTQTGLLLRKVTTLPTAIGDTPTKTDYEDYREVGDGTKYPYLIRVTAVTTRRTFFVQKVQDNVAVDAAKFTMPESKPAPAQR